MKLTPYEVQNLQQSLAFGINHMTETKKLLVEKLELSPNEPVIQKAIKVIEAQLKFVKSTIDGINKVRS